MGARHLHYGVETHHYSVVGNSLIKTIAQTAGDAWTTELQQIWSDAIQAVASLMLNGADQAAASKDTNNSFVVTISSRQCLSY